MMLAVSAPAVMAAAGIAIDFGIYNMKLTKLQTAADQAAIAAVKELGVVNFKKASVKAAAESFARETVRTPSSALDVAVEVGKDSDEVSVVVTEHWTPFFAEFIGAKMTPIVARASARMAGKANICVLTLNSSASKAIHLDKQAKISATGCGVYSNSMHVQAIRLDQDSEIKASLVCAVGGVKAKTTAVSPAPITDCPVLQDPLSSRMAPAVGPCLSTSLKISSGAQLLTPGNYCGGIKITGSADVTFKPGVYVVSDGVFEISGDAKVKSENAGFYLKGDATTINFTGKTTVSMTGAIAGEMAGLLFFEDRAAPVGRTHRINSENASTLTGTIYLPNGRLRVDPNSSVAQDSAYTAIIAMGVEVDEGPTLVLNSDYGASNVPVPDGIRISTQVVLSK
jgi:hypothetical protein